MKWWFACARTMIAGEACLGLKSSFTPPGTHKWLAARRVRVLRILAVDVLRDLDAVVRQIGAVARG